MDSIRRIGIAAGFCLLSSCATQRSLPSMGSFIQVSVNHKFGGKHSPDLYVDIQNRLDQIEKQFSLYIQDSDLSRWNRGERNFKTGEDFKFLLAEAKSLKRRSHGYFDVSALKTKGTPMSFDGIAKGFAVDEVALIIEAAGYPRYKINFSGNLKWKTSMSAGAAASSGNLHRPGHILNPKTLEVNLQKEESLVQGPNAMICDALSTAYFAAPKDQRARIEKNFPDYQFSMGD